MLSGCIVKNSVFDWSKEKSRKVQGEAMKAVIFLCGRQKLSLDATNPDSMTKQGAGSTLHTFPRFLPFLESVQISAIKIQAAVFVLAD